MAYVQIKLDFITDEKDSEELIKQLEHWHLNNPINMSRLDISKSKPINLPKNL